MKAGALRQSKSETQVEDESGRSGLLPHETHIESSPERPDLKSLVAEIRERHKIHEDYVRAWGDMTRRTQSICRRLICPKYGCKVREKGGKHGKECAADTTALWNSLRKGTLEHEESAVAFMSIRGLFESLDHLEGLRKEAERQLKPLVAQLPVWPWVESVRGVSYGSLARLVGEIGNLSDYSNPAKVWARMGVGIRTIDGVRVRQRKSVEHAMIHRYSPRRRSILFAAMEPLIRQNAEYKAIYDARRAHTAVTHPEWTKGHSHYDAHAVMSKAFLKDLWVAWNAQVVGEARASISAFQAHPENKS